MRVPEVPQRKGHLRYTSLQTSQGLAAPAGVAVIGAELGLINFNGALQLTARRGDVAEDHVRLSEVPSRLGYVHIFRTKVTLEDRERSLKQL